MSTNSLSSSRITELLVALQPYRGSIVLSHIPNVITKSELTELVRLDYLHHRTDMRVDFTPKAYTHLKS